MTGKAYIQKKPAEELKPPVTSVGVVGWAKINLFNGWFNSFLTLATLFMLYKTVPPLIRWAFIDAAWATSGIGCREASGACWSVIKTLRAD